MVPIRLFITLTELDFLSFWNTRTRRYGSTKTFAVPAVVHRVTVVGQATEEGQASYAAIDRNREIAISFMRQTLQG